jgi:hypothetical protein
MRARASTDVGPLSCEIDPDPNLHQDAEVDSRPVSADRLPSTLAISWLVTGVRPKVRFST